MTRQEFTEDFAPIDLIIDETMYTISKSKNPLEIDFGISVEASLYVVVIRFRRITKNGLEEEAEIHCGGSSIEENAEKRLGEVKKAVIDFLDKQKEIPIEHK